MSYGTDHGAQWRRGAEIVDLILKGAKPADIPVEQPTKFETVINLKDHRGTRYRDLTVVARYRRRGDRVNRLNFCFGTKRFPGPPAPSAGPPARRPAISLDSAPRRSHAVL